MKSKILEHKKYILLLVAILVVSALIVFLTDYYSRYQAEKSRVANEQIQQEADKEKLRAEELETLRGEIESLKNRPPQTIVQNIAPKSGGGDTPTLSGVVKEWTPRVAQITCKYVLLPGTGGSLPKYGISTDPQYGAGSGFLMELYGVEQQQSQIAVVTNRHVLTGHNGFSPANTCTVTIGEYSYDVYGLGDGKEDVDIYSLHYPEGPKDNEVLLIDGEPYSISDPDAGYLLIRNPDPEIKKLAQIPARCSQRPQIGEDIVILGFPAIGATQSITATNGIVSGVDPKYYVTSAKIEQGNSGGAAFWIKENCYIGIPTFALAGEIESLARILDIEYLFKN